MATLTKDEQIQVLDGILDDIASFDALAPRDIDGHRAFRGAVMQKVIQRGYFLRGKATTVPDDAEPEGPVDRGGRPLETDREGKTE